MIEIPEGLVDQIKRKMQEDRPVQVEGSTLTFEGKRQYALQAPNATTTVNMTVSLNGTPMDIKRAYAIVLQANEAWLDAVCEARAVIMTQQTQIADLNSELDRLRPVE
jgi:hypothetical protein